MPIRLSCPTLISLLVLSHTANAYTLMGPRWPASSLPVAWQLDSAGSDDITDGSDLSEVKRAVKAWENVACSRLTFTEPSALTGKRQATDDGINKVFWIESNWEYGRNTLGVTTPKYYSTQEMFDADIEFNGQDYDWTAGQGNYCGGSGCVDVFSIALHEFGHFFGLDHSSGSNAVMFASYPGYPKQTLSQDDIDGICALYPSANAGTGASGSSCAQDGDCKTALSCVAQTAGAGRVCTATCSGPNATTCPSGTQCKAIPSGYACLSDAPPGSAEGEVCNQSTPCQGDLWCVGFGGAEGACRRRCNVNEGNSCGPNYKCQAVGTGAVCLPSGTQGETAECGECASTAMCSAGLTCLVDDDGKGRCRTPCANDNVCGGDERCVSKGSEWACSCPGLDPKIEGEACSRTAECAENAVCVADGTTSGTVCRTVCNPESPACAAPKECVKIEDAHVCTRPPADTTPDALPDSPVADGCGCASPLGFGWFASFALLLRMRRRR